FSPTRWLTYQPAMGEMRWPVPAIPTLGELSHFFDLSSSELEWFADVRSLERRVSYEPLRHYRYRWVDKKRGGARLIEAPKQRLREIQRHLLRTILDRIPPHESAHGFVRGRSAVTFALGHTSSDIVLRLDLREFLRLDQCRSRVRRLPDGWLSRVGCALVDRTDNQRNAARGMAGRARCRARGLHVRQEARTTAPAPGCANIAGGRVSLCTWA